MIYGRRDQSDGTTRRDATSASQPSTLLVVRTASYEVSCTKSDCFVARLLLSPTANTTTNDEDYNRERQQETNKESSRCCRRRRRAAADLFTYSGIFDKSLLTSGLCAILALFLAFGSSEPLPDFPTGRHPLHLVSLCGRLLMAAFPPTTTGTVS